MLGAAAMAGQPVRGLIVTLQPRDVTPGAPTVIEPRREDRLAAVAREAGVDLHSQRPLGQPGRHLLRLPAVMQGAALDSTLRRLRLHPEVLAVEPDVLIKRLAVPNDPDFATQWYLQTPLVFAAAINTPPAWDRTTGSAAITVAVLDTGIRPHPDLAGRTVAGHDFVSEVEFGGDGDGRDADPTDPGDWVTATGNNPAVQQLVDLKLCDVGNSSWHGTFIAGQIAAATQNAAGIAGVDWRGRVLPVRISGKCGAFLSDILDGMRWAAGLPVAGAPANATPARVINLSFGGDTACSPAYQATIDEVTAAGALVVVAAGNESRPLRRPADCRGVLAVGAVQTDGLKTFYSNTGAGLMAPGGSGNGALRLYSTDNTGAQGPGAESYGYKQGTSFSAPLAVGVAALMLAVNPALTPLQIAARLQAGARPHVFNAFAPTCGETTAAPCNCTPQTCGAGLLDALASVQLALGPAVRIAAVPPPLAGATVVLDGRTSAAVPGAALVSFEWTQLSGTPVAIQGAATALAQVALPAQAGTFVFRLQVTDSEGRTGADQITLTSTAPPSGGGGGAAGWLWGAELWALALLAAWRRLRR